MDRVVVVAVEIVGCIACAGLTFLACRRMMSRQAAADKDRIENLAALLVAEAALLAQEKISCDKWQVKAEDLMEVNGLLTEAASQRDFFKAKAAELEAKWRKAFPVRARLPNGEFVPRKKPDHPVVAAILRGSRT